MRKAAAATALRRSGSAHAAADEGKRDAAASAGRPSATSACTAELRTGPWRCLSRAATAAMTAPSSEQSSPSRNVSLRREVPRTSRAAARTSRLASSTQLTTASRTALAPGLATSFSALRRASRSAPDAPGSGLANLSAKDAVAASSPVGQSQTMLAEAAARTSVESSARYARRWPKALLSPGLHTLPNASKAACRTYHTGELRGTTTKPTTSGSLRPTTPPTEAKTEMAEARIRTSC
mmetsp:Transcript_10611/g.28184  ORF Transcript_10611/g.28184 Transcript_10611/m.28184 type:complete len:238 (+) Transcript_10611:470-1183(+)